MLDFSKNDQRNTTANGDSGGYEFDAERDKEQKISHEEFVQNKRDKRTLAIVLGILLLIASLSNAF